MYLYPDRITSYNVCYTKLLRLCLPINAVAQESFYSKTNEYNVGVGYIEYKNTVAVPSGLPGTSTFFEYKKANAKSSNKSHGFDFNIRADYAHLKRNSITSDVNIPYHHFEFASTAKWNWNMPLTCTKLLFNYGVGFVITSYSIHYTKLYEIKNYSKKY